MIQRIQTIFLIIGAAALVIFNFLALGIDTTPEPDNIVFGQELLPIFISSLVIASLVVISIFLFSNRILQMNICKLNLILTILLAGLTGYFLFGNPINAIEIIREGIAMPFIAIVFIGLGLKKIGGDEKLVRSIDRLR